jgi:ribosomal protein S12 methylthiotransferase accessory factor
VLRRASEPDEPTFDFLKTALAAARLCGVTRLADVTGLDRLGLPVWQAVRPAGWSLSVHQGKGAWPAQAKIGALCEAIEAHCAERVPGDGPVTTLASLPEGQRAAEISDYCRDRSRVPPLDARVRWSEAADLASGAACYLPHNLVSLDFRSETTSLFERVSGGLGAGPDEEHALSTALLELVERDAVGEWQRQDAGARAVTALKLGSVPFEWFREWRERLACAGADLQVFELKTAAAVPAFLCIVGGAGEFGKGYRRFEGHAAHGSAETALFKALAEAIQSRLTFIAGVRDDFLPSAYRRQEASRRPQDWPPDGALPWHERETVARPVEHVVEQLARRGFRQVAVKRLGEGLEGVSVVRAFVPGLGSLTRTRRT